MTVRRTLAGVEFVRTPDERFAALDDWPYEPHWVDVEGLRMAYVDEGPRGGSTVLMLHGEPTWGYLYRRMVPPIVAAGYRVIVPDLIGFGRSDKPTDRATYTYAQHVAWMRSFVEQRELRDLTLFCQDWGGLIGLRVVAELDDRFSRLVIANTALPDGSSMGEGFNRWQEFSQSVPDLDCGALLQRAVQARQLTAEEVAGYRAPFPDPTYLAGARQFPVLVPTSPDDPAVPANLAAWAALEHFERPVLTLWAPQDVVLGGFQSSFIERIPGAAGQPHRQFVPGGHFIQDDRGEDVAAAMLEWMGGL